MHEIVPDYDLNVARLHSNIHTMMLAIVLFEHFENCAFRSLYGIEEELLLTVSIQRQIYQMADWREQPYIALDRTITWQPGGNHTVLQSNHNE